MRQAGKQNPTTALNALASVSYEEFLESIAVRVADKLLDHIGETDTQQEYLGTAEVTQMLGISKGTLHKRIEEGLLPEPLYGGGKGGKRIWKLEQFK